MKSLILSWKLFRISLHLFSGITLTLLFVRNGIHNSSTASRLFIWWNDRLCQIFKARISISGEMNQEATLYVMNHISWFDIPALASQKPLHFLSKAEVKSWPLIGRFTERAGTLFIQRGAAGAAENSLNEITQCLEAGGSVVIFPEGTTTDGSGLRKFHSRLLQAAIDARVKIQPIALRYPYKEGINPHVPYIDELTFMDSVMGLTKSKPLNVELHFLQSIDHHLSNNNDMSNKQLALLARQAIASKLKIKT
ncbi:MAG: 1-acyl-sn-glycerol-3-phosphate acyltransferase [endosymbiont of Galathealinum brachiosum]|uniref:1-acyl-sn-glycerol-3-phosphate acyltransferase n=1 Tax=endosymbiont of Galathealinum brachiosum TaxID=2200906 RepID=A0A370D9H9_9GAMM|nr:MAG: 1-acyl-sn-glycerol-3-phosphate acyltransferase [endosymbiont of Galathealinum brachiosum]